jgi:hypothetical protein
MYQRSRHLQANIALAPSLQLQMQVGHRVPSTRLPLRRIRILTNRTTEALQLLLRWHLGVSQLTSTVLYLSVEHLSYLTPPRSEVRPFSRRIVAEQEDTQVQTQNQGVQAHCANRPLCLKLIRSDVASCQSLCPSWSRSRYRRLHSDRQSRLQPRHRRLRRSHRA